MGNYYKLKIYQRGQAQEPEIANEKSTFYIESSTAFNKRALLNVIPSNTDIQLILKSLEYSKELYRPSSADVVIQTSAKKTSSSDIVKAVMECFRDKSAEISVSDKDGITDEADYFLGKDFLVYSVQPHYEADSSSGVMIDVKLYSRDVLLTEDKFSHCYINKKLGRDIIEGSLKEGGMLSTLDIKYSVDENRLQVLKTGNNKELIQPYRVQYNEDFHSFVSRLAGRCGEFLYFEDGKLCFGLPSGSASTLENSVNIKSVRYPQMLKSPLKVKSFYRDYQKDDTSVDKDELVFNEDSPYDEYFDVFDKSELPDSFGSELLFGPFINLILTGLFPALSAWKHHRWYLTASGLTKYFSDTAQELGKIAVKSSYVNDKYTEHVFSNSDKNTDGFKKDEQTINDKLSQFASVVGYDKLLSTYYSAVKTAEKEVKDSVICLEVVANSTGCRLRLGDKVKLGNEDDEYVVCKVSGTAKWEKNVSEDEGAPALVFNDSQYIEIVPKKTIDATANGGSSDSVFLPPYEEDSSKAVSAQIAIVEDSDDPRYLGRVRIKYPWQSKSESASPWVRFITPMASKSGARMHFKLTKGDEVMVDYIGGNVERPYVIGAMYNKDAKPDKYLYFPDDRAIISENGEKILFQASNYDKLITDLVPLSGYLMPFLPPLTNAIKSGLDNAGSLGDMLKTIHGKVILTDTYGFWTIEGDTAGRSITIDSMLGKVTVSALTGINISAPLGDVTIEGKNINIKASNNITIESGLEIKEERKKDESTFAVSGAKQIVSEMASDCVADLIAGKLDYQILRAIAEVIVAPMEGTLKIKSNRYLNLEAGTGNAFDLGVDPGFISKADRAKAATATNLISGDNGKRLKSSLNSIKLYVNNLCTGLAGKYHNAYNAITNFRTFFDAHNGSCVMPVSPEDIIDQAQKTRTLDLSKHQVFSHLLLSQGPFHDVYVQYKDLAEGAFSQLREFWAMYSTLKDTYQEVAFGKALVVISDCYKKDLQALFDMDYVDDLTTEALERFMKCARRRCYAKFLSAINPEGMVFSLRESDADDDKKWEEGVRTMFVQTLPSWSDKIVNTFAKSGWSFVNYDKYQSESYVKYPTARGKLLFSQEAGKCFEILGNGTFKVGNTGNDLLTLQRLLLEDDNFMA